MALTNLEVISVPVSDQDRAKSFYAEQARLLGRDGQRVRRRRHALGDAAPARQRDRDHAGDLVRDHAGGSLKGSVLGCDDLEKTLADLTARGVTFAEDEIQEAPWGRWKTFDDPDGNGWVLQQNNPAFPG